MENVKILVSTTPVIILFERVWKIGARTMIQFSLN